MRKSFSAYLQKARGLCRSDRRTGENGHRKSSSEPDRRRPGGTARPNYTNAFKTHLSHAASSVIIESSLALAPFDNQKSYSNQKEHLTQQNSQ